MVHIPFSYNKNNNTIDNHQSNGEWMLQYPTSHAQNPMPSNPGQLDYIFKLWILIPAINCNDTCKIILLEDLVVQHSRPHQIRSIQYEPLHTLIDNQWLDEFREFGNYIDFPP